MSTVGHVLTLNLVDCWSCADLKSWGGPCPPPPLTSPLLSQTHAKKVRKPARRGPRIHHQLRLQGRLSGDSGVSQESGVLDHRRGGKLDLHRRWQKPVSTPEIACFRKLSEQPLSIIPRRKGWSVPELNEQILSAY